MRTIKEKSIYFKFLSTKHSYLIIFILTSLRMVCWKPLDVLCQTDFHKCNSRTGQTITHGPHRFHGLFLYSSWAKNGLTCFNGWGKIKGRIIFYDILTFYGIHLSVAINHVFGAQSWSFISTLSVADLTLQSSVTEAVQLATPQIRAVCSSQTRFADPASSHELHIGAHLNS